MRSWPLAFIVFLFPTVSPADPLPAAYFYPEQPARLELVKCDPDARSLSDGKSPASGTSCVFGKWGAREVWMDWDFGRPVRVRRVKASIIHPNANSHPDGLRLFAGDPASNYPPDPDFVLSIPFTNAPLQEISLDLSGDGLVTRLLRTRFTTARQQVALSELAFEGEVLPPAEADAWAKRAAARNAREPVAFLPMPRGAAVPAPVTPWIFGVCGHMIHIDWFYPPKEGQPGSGFSAYWGPDYTLPLIEEARLAWVREPLYSSLFTNGGPSALVNGKTCAENRAWVERALGEYEKTGACVLLAPMFPTNFTPAVAEFASWVGGLTKRFPCARAVELHNEPNLKGFWKGSARQFVEVARAFAAEVKKANAKATVVAGSFSGWGGAWDHPDLRELVAGDKGTANAWAKEAFRLGLLEFADGVSAHPYRGSSAPEGGDILRDRLDPDGFAKEIRDFLDLAREHTPGKKSLPLWITEIGYSVSATRGYSKVPTESRQADYLSRLMLLLLDLKLSGVPIEGVFWYDLKQDETKGDEYEGNFGIVARDTSRPRPAWLALRRLSSFFGKGDDWSRAKIGVATRNGADCMKILCWKRASDGAMVVAFWRMQQRQWVDEDFATALTLLAPAGVRSVTLHDLNEDRPRRIGFTASGNAVTIPVQVTSRAGWVVLGKE